MTHDAGEIRIALDTGGVAAGGLEILATFEKEIHALGRIRLKRVGTTGLCYADPQVEVDVPGLPHAHYGRVTPAFARRIVAEHILRGKLCSSDSDGSILLAGRRNGNLTGPVSQIAVAGEEEKTSARAATLLQSLIEPALGPDSPRKIHIAQAADFGVFHSGVSMQFFPGGLVYGGLRESDFEAIVQKTVLAGEEIPNHPVRDPQVHLVTRRIGRIDPESIEDYVQVGGYAALICALREPPEKLVEAVKTSGLRGRGGAGYPTGKKWELTRAQSAEQKYVICNADEGDPGTFKDRSLLESDPHSVLEGLILAGYAVGASTGFFYVRAEYPLAAQRIRKAIEDAKARGFLGRNILGSGFDMEVLVRLGAGAYVCGEETALIASIEGKRGSPHPRPPYPSEHGLYGMPTCINNVETLGTVTAILEKGSAWYSSLGYEASRGTKVFSVTGKVRYPRLVEVPFGTSLREVIFTLCGGPRPGKKIKGVLTGGPSGGVIPEHLLDTPVAYETIRSLGSMIGSGGMMAVDHDDSMVDLIRFYLNFNVDESCGKCASCRIGGFQLRRLFEGLAQGRADRKDLEQIKTIAHTMQRTSLCGLGQAAPGPIFSTLRHFPHEYEACIGKTNASSPGERQ
jgi:NADP-reducing hydrogenase subunit HndC